jgi:NAD-dependent deacetylase
LNRNRCFACNEPHEFLQTDIDEIERVDLALAENATPPKLLPPSCLRCGGYLRPDVIWFGEELPEKEWASAVNAVRGCDLILCVGTSGLVYPAARLPTMGQRSGATIIQVNPNSTDLDDIADINLRGSAGEVLPDIVASISERGMAAV